MIVDPDFPDHWKTRLLVDSLDSDEAAPMYVIRIWAHCQHRRTSTFPNLTPAALKALCRYPGHPNKLESSLTASGFVRREDGVLIVHEWEQYNASLIANWENGKKGGRPPRTEKKEPTGNPPETHGLSMANPNETDKSREDKNKALSPHARGDLPEKPPPAITTPTREIVREAAQRSGIPQDIADMFFDSAESRPLTPDGGWTRYNGQPMEMNKWQHALAAFAASVQRNQSSRGAAAGKPKTKGQSKYVNEF